MFTFKKISIIAILDFSSTYINAQDDLAGECPEVAFGWDRDFQGRMDWTRLVGHWRNVFDSDHTSGHDCLSMNLDEVRGNYTMLQVRQGGLTPHDPGFANVHEKENGVPLGRRLLYDNNGVLVFNDPSDTSISALQDINDPDPDHLGELANYDIAPLSEEE